VDRGKRQKKVLGDILAEKEESYKAWVAAKDRQITQLTRDAERHEVEMRRLRTTYQSKVRSLQQSVKEARGEASATRGKGGVPAKRRGSIGHEYSKIMCNSCIPAPTPLSYLF
jgi:hypothetical protein